MPDCDPSKERCDSAAVKFIKENWQWFLLGIGIFIALIFILLRKDAISCLFGTCFAASVATST